MAHFILMMAEVVLAPQRRRWSRGRVSGWLRVVLCNTGRAWRPGRGWQL